MKSAEPSRTARGSKPNSDRRAIEIEASPTRCPYCRDSIAVDLKGWVVCEQCLARHHTECWEEFGRCCACRSSARLAPTALESSEAAIVVAPDDARAIRRYATIHLFLGLGIALSALLAAYSAQSAVYAGTLCYGLALALTIINSAMGRQNRRIVEAQISTILAIAALAILVTSALIEALRIAPSQPSAIILLLGQGLAIAHGLSWRMLLKHGAELDSARQDEKKSC